jgi:hypothetical protein
MTGCRAMLPLASLLMDAVDAGRILSPVSVRPHSKTTLVSAHAPCCHRALSLPRNSSVAEVDPLAQPRKRCLAIRPRP